MSKGPGHVERAIVALLRQNEHLSAPLLAVLVYQDPPDGCEGAWEPRPVTTSEHASIRRALSKLHKQGTVVKLGNLFRGERCSYASREQARVIVHKAVECFGKDFFRDHPNLVDLAIESN